MLTQQPMLRRLTLLLVIPLFLVPLRTASAQEFRCSVSVNYASLSGTDYSFLDELRDRILEYMNRREWTDDRFLSDERIDCSMQIVMTDATGLTNFRARLIVAMRRPIYGTAQQTTVLQLNDESWSFEYTRGTPLVFQPDRFHPITSVLDFYAYLMLGFDYDTFSLRGGQPWFQEARRIAQTAQGAGGTGWSSIGGNRTRGELIDQIVDSRFRPLREAYFHYHYGGLDSFLQDQDKARNTVLEVIEGLSVLRENVARSYYLDQFFSAKYQELASIFKESRQASQAFELLSVTDPPHVSDYSAMLN
ncbi:MAG: DUF4835 domain-containing protein [Bacteroidetes bacterium CG12_big_fil_rev_8_21_14_0_65_60_17]|nr:MAG: DUF4835 domain-containing protein [Bacteroidetes bacterium CG12_big_fil_rev_8_21_14_0_65_60_17]